MKLSEPSTSKLDLNFCEDLTEEDFEDVSIVESSQSSNESSEMDLDVNLNDSFESNHSQKLLKAVTKHENEECQTEDSFEDDFHIFSETIDIEETKPELTDSGLVTKVNHEIIKIETSNPTNPLMKKAAVSLQKLSDKTIKKYAKESDGDLTEVESDDHHSDINETRLSKTVTPEATNTLEEAKNVRYKCDKCEKEFTTNYALEHRLLSENTFNYIKG